MSKFRKAQAAEINKVSIANLIPRVGADRDALLHRLARLPATVKERSGYKTATILLGKTFLIASHSTQITPLQAASFMAEVLEKLPPT
jgi:hypothetical protein